MPIDSAACRRCVSCAIKRPTYGAAADNTRPLPCIFAQKAADSCDIKAEKGDQVEVHYLVSLPAEVPLGTQQAL